MNKIENIDCLEYIKGLSDNSVDLVLTDPPYFIGFDGGKGWDSKWKTEKEYLDWCKEWTTECVRVLKDNRMLIVWGTLKTDTFLRYKLDILNSFDNMVGQNEIIWSYNWGGRAKTNFARKHEYAFCYSKGKDFLFNSSDIRIPRKLKKNLKTGKEYSEGTIPTCVWEKNNHTTSKDFINWHPTTKNLELLDRIIKAYTNENDVVLDIFMGSGSTAMSCLRTNRKYLGCESNKEYYEKICERIKTQKTQKNYHGVLTFDM